MRRTGARRANEAKGPKEKLSFMSVPAPSPAQDARARQSDAPQLFGAPDASRTLPLTLLVMAAGMGSRFGGLKQMEPVGPCGETIIDYSVYDAMRAGFERIVFVIAHGIESDFRRIVGERFEKRLAVDYVFQELDDLPAGFALPAGRVRPWGTGHAVLAAADAVHEPFAVINGDDFYGRESFALLAGRLRDLAGAPGGMRTGHYALVGFILRQTLSEFGTVARGVCQVAGERLVGITERTGVEPDGRGGATCADGSGGRLALMGDEIVSMNMWGFTPDVFGPFSEEFRTFLREHGSEAKAEFYLPTAVSATMARGKASVDVLTTSDAWFGVTYRQDKPMADRAVRELVARGVYAENLWQER